MNFLYGATLLFVAVALYSASRIIYRNQAAKLEAASFGPAELVALVITGISAAGLAEMAQAFANNWSLLGLAEGAAAITAVTFASMATNRVIRRALVGGNRAALRDLAPTGAN